MKSMLQEHSGTKEIQDILQAIFGANSKADNILKLRKKIPITKIFACFSNKMKNTPIRSKQKPKFLDDFVVVPPQEKVILLF